MESIEPVIKSLTESIENGELINQTLIEETGDGISLLALKNDALLSYISNLLILAAAQLEKNDHVFQESRKRTIEQRVTLEKGIKGLEAKISYQIDKSLRAYKRFQEQQLEDEKRQTEKEAAELDNSDSEEDLTSYRPDVSSMAAGSGSGSGSRKKPHRRDYSDDEDSGLEDDDKKRYVVPKISATAPAFEKEKSTRRTPRNRRDVAMDEYIRETGEAPVAEPSIGSQIMDSGRGGERTARDRKRADEVRAYEEANFTRISQTSAKRARKDAAQRQRDAISKSFFGEDWGFLDERDQNKRGSGGKKRKTKH